MKIELVSKQFHKFGGKLRKKGERFFATPAEAKALTALGRAMTAENAPAAPAAPEVRTKRAYKRRDMQAETLAEPAPAAPAPAEPEPPKSLVDEVARVKDEFRSQWILSETLKVTRPKKDTAE